MFNFSICNIFVRFTFTGFAFRTSGKTEEATAHSQSTQVSFSTCDVRTTGCDSKGFLELCLWMRMENLDMHNLNHRKRVFDLHAMHKLVSMCMIKILSLDLCNQFI